MGFFGGLRPPLKLLFRLFSFPFPDVDWKLVYQSSSLNNSLMIAAFVNHPKIGSQPMLWTRTGNMMHEAAINIQIFLMISRRLGRHSASILRLSVDSDDHNRVKP
jgi:hypothetical protein